MARVLNKSAAQLVEEARGQIEELAPEEVAAGLKEGTMVVIDLRDVRELHREGKIPGALHCPRGMLEFWLDPDSPYYKPDMFGDETKKYVFHCASGWRSALATRAVKDMGLEPVAHLAGGFGAWRNSGQPVESVD